MNNIKRKQRNQTHINDHQTQYMTSDTKSFKRNKQQTAHNKQLALNNIRHTHNLINNELNIKHTHIILTTRTQSTTTINQGQTHYKLIERHISKSNANRLTSNNITHTARDTTTKHQTHVQCFDFNNLCSR